MPPPGHSVYAKYYTVSLDVTIVNLRSVVMLILIENYTYIPTIQDDVEGQN